MNRCRVLGVFCTLWVSVSVFGLPGALNAAVEARSPQSYFEENPNIQEFNDQVFGRYDRADSAVRADLDERLAIALNHYYDNRYGKAYEAFRSFEASYLTAEFHYFYADAAFKAEDYPAAIQQYRRLLSVDPDLHLVRLDLAVAYSRNGDPAAARKTLRRIDSEALPEYLQNRLAQLKALVEKTPKAHAFRLYVSQNIQWDSNIGVVPDEDLIVAPNGAAYRFTGSSKKEDGWRSETLARIFWDYQRFTDKGFQWKTASTLYNLEYFDSGRYDSLLWKVRSGPAWRLDPWTLAAPLTFGQRYYSDSRLYDLYGVSPRATYRVNSRFRVNGRLGFFKKSYADDEDGALDKDIRTYEIEPVFYYNRAWDYIGLSLAWEEDRADAPRFSKDTWKLSLSASAHFTDDISGYVRYTHRFEDYRDPYPGWTSDREEDEDSLYLSVTKTFSNGLFLDANFYWANNDTNTDIFDYDRIICGAGIGFRF